VTTLPRGSGPSRRSTRLLPFPASQPQPEWYEHSASSSKGSNEGRPSLARAESHSPGPCRRAAPASFR
jgi:hypothetical protein